MVPLQRELALYQYVNIPEVPTFTGGAIGYVAYDCIQHFEPKTKAELKRSAVRRDWCLKLPICEGWERLDRNEGRVGASAD